MSSKNASSKVVSVDEETFEQADEEAVDEDGFEVVDETPEFQASVDMEVQAKVDANHPDGIADTCTERIDGATFEQEERIRAREAELEYISEKAKLSEQKGRAKRTRDVVVTASEKQRTEFQKRAASAGNGADPDKPDVRERLDAEDLGMVNKYARKLNREVSNAPEPSAISRMLAEKVDDGKSMMTAVIATKEELYEESGCPQPIETLESWMANYEMGVTIEGEVTALWKPKSVSQQQVGLIEDETGTVKFTVWENSMQTTVLSEGDQVRVTGAKVGWYNGQATLAADGETDIQILERGDGPSPVHGLRYQVKWNADTPKSPSIDDEQDERDVENQNSIEHQSMT